MLTNRGAQAGDVLILTKPLGVGAIAAIVRGDEVVMAHHDTVVQAEDHVIVFVTDKQQLPKVEKLFEVSVGFV